MKARTKIQLAQVACQLLHDQLGREWQQATAKNDDAKLATLSEELEHVRAWDANLKKLRAAETRDARKAVP